VLWDRKEKGNGHKKNRRIARVILCECGEVFDLVGYLKRGKRVKEVKLRLVYQEIFIKPVV